jgi:nucleoside-diphosphate-sugar epimerase
MIHRTDAVGAILAALLRGKSGQIYNVVDDQPVPQRALLEWLATQLGLPGPQVGSAQKKELPKRGLTSKRVSNRKLTEELGYRLQFPTFREGYAALLGPEPFR